MTDAMLNAILLITRYEVSLSMFLIVASSGSLKMFKFTLKGSIRFWGIFCIIVHRTPKFGLIL